MNRKIRSALTSTKNIPELKRRIAGLSDRDLELAMKFERLNDRHYTTLKLLAIEQKERQGKGHKWARLKVEAKV